MSQHAFRTHLGADFVSASGARVRAFQMVSRTDGHAYATVTLVDERVESFAAAPSCASIAHAWMATVTKENVSAPAAPPRAVLATA